MSLKNRGNSPQKISLVLVAGMMLLVLSQAWAEDQPKSFLSRGTHLVGGSFTFSSAGDTYFENSDGDRTQEWIVRPGGGYFFADNLAFDLHIEGRWFIQGDVESSHYSMGPIMQYYFNTVGSDDPKGHAIPYLGLGYLWGLARQEAAGSEAKFSSGMWSMSAGLSWMLSNVVAVDLELNYLTGEFTEQVPVDGVARDANRISFFIGVKAFLP